MNESLWEEVEAILAHKKTKRGLVSYLVLWKDHSVEAATWEPEENVLQCSELISEYMKNPRLNVTKTQIVQEWKEEKRRMKTYASQSSTEESEDEPEIKHSKEPTKQDILDDLKTDDLLKRRTKILREQQADLSKPFDTRAFLKLGFSVSAIVVLCFLLFSNSDDFHLQEYLRSMSAANFPKVDPSRVTRS